MADLTNLRVLGHKSKPWLGYFMAGALLFAAGFQVGKVTSPYYASHPIVFSNSVNIPEANSGGSPEELAALQEEGRALAAKTTSVSSPAATPLVSPAVAGVQDSTTKKAFVGSVNSNLYHHPDCPSAKRIQPQNQVWFASEDEAKAAGYAPSQCTKDKLGIQ